MIQTKDLFLLVNSFTAGEKRLFNSSMDQKDDRKFLFLYELMLSSKRWEEVRTRFEEKYSKSEYETSRKYLYKIVMKILRTSEECNSIEHLLYNKIIEIKILFNKGLYNQCFKELEGAKDQAKKSEKLFILTELSILELEYLNVLDFPAVDEKGLIAKHENIEENLYKEIFINKHRSLYEILQWRYLTTGAPKKADEVVSLNDLLIEEFRIRSNKNYTLFNSDKAHLRFQATYFRMVGDQNGSLNICYELEELFKKGNLSGRTDDLSYLFLLNDILTTLRLLNKYEDMLYFLNKLKEMETESELLTTYKDFFHFIHECSILIDNSNATSLNQVTENYQALIHKQKFLPVNYNLLLHFQYAVMLFVAEEYVKSLKIISKIPINKNEQLSKKGYYLTKLLSIMIHLHLENFDFLQYEIRSIERNLGKEKNKFMTWDLIIKLVKNLANAVDHKVLLLEACSALKQLEKDELEYQFLVHLPIRQWFEKRVLM